MATTNLNTSKIFHHKRIYTNVLQMSTLGRLNDTHKQSGSAWYVVTTPCHIEVNKVNSKITSTRHGNLSEHFPIKKLGIKWAQLSSNNLRIDQYILQQSKNHIWGISTGINSNRQHHQASNSISDFTTPRKITGRTLCHVTIHRKTDPYIHMDRSTNYLIGNTEGRWPCY